MVNRKYFDALNYHPLSPTTITNKTDSEEFSRIEPYINNLEEATKNPTVKNIAVFGKFGAGKTTVINSFLNQHKEDLHKWSTFLSHETGSNRPVKPDKIRPLQLSTATFTRTMMQEHNRSNDQWIEIERNLVQQMLYGPKNKVLRNSKFRKIEQTGYLRWFIAWLSLLTFLITWFLLIGSPRSLSIFFDKGDLIIAQKFFYMPLLISIGILTTQAFWYFPRYFNSAKIGIGKNELIVTDKHSAFNQYLDEIIYFFSRTKYNIVIFEDLDRADDLNIFEHLRELNQILNSNQLIRESYKVEENHPAIRFVYAVKEDLFDNQMLASHRKATEKASLNKDDKYTNDDESDSDIAEATTKFFDWTLTILPRVSSINAPDFLMQAFSKPTDEFKNYLRAIGGFFEDVRVLENSLNDLKLCLKLQQGNGLNVEKLFTALLFKNGFPTEYQKYLNNIGSLSKLIRTRDFAEQHSKSLRETLKILQSRKETLVKYSQRAVVDHYFYIFMTAGAKTTSRIESQDQVITIRSIKNMSFSSLQRLYTYLKEKNMPAVISPCYNSPFVPVADLVITDPDFDSDAIFVDNELPNQISNIDEEIIKAKNNIDNIESESLTSLCHDNASEVSNFLNESNNASGFLTFAIVNGYLDENMDEYFSLFTGERISRNDHSIVMNIRSGLQVPFDQRIDNVQSFVAELVQSDFNMPSFALRDLILYIAKRPSFNKNGAFVNAFDCAIKHLSLQNSEDFSDHLNELVALSPTKTCLKRIVSKISEHNEFDWSKYKGGQIQEIAPIILNITTPENIRKVLKTCSPLLDYLNNNQWNDSVNAVINQPTIADKIYGFPKITLNQLNTEKQSDQTYIDYLIDHKAVACLPETLPTILEAYNSEDKQPLSYSIALMHGNEKLKVYIGKCVDSFLTAELKLHLVANETKQSLTALLCLPNISSSTLKNVLEHYSGERLDLSKIILLDDSKKEFPENIKLIINSGMAKFSWENLQYLLSFQKSESNHHLIETFIEETGDFAEMSEPHDDESKTTLRDVVSTFQINATNANKSVLACVSDYSIAVQSEKTQNTLINWHLAALNVANLEINLTQSQLVVLSGQYLSEKEDSWNDNQKRLFSKLSTSTLVEIISNLDHPLKQLSNIALDKILNERLADPILNDKLRQSLIMALANASEVNESAMIRIFLTFDNETSQLAVLIHLVKSSSAFIPNKMLIKFIAKIPDKNINQLAQVSDLTLKIVNPKPVEPLLNILRSRRLISTQRYIKHNTEVVVRKLASLRSINRSLQSN